MLQLNNDFHKSRKLEQHVENRTVYTLDKAELSIFETHKEAKSISLDFKKPVLASMIKGRKIMHLNGQSPFDFIPGESVIMPEKEVMTIDFPDATVDNPTQCLALTFGKDIIQDTLEKLNTTSPKVDNKEWSLVDYNFHFSNDVAINQILQRLIFLFAENHTSKDFFCDLMVQELIIRILQNENKQQILDKSKFHKNSGRMNFIVNYIQENLQDDLTVQKLSDKANMSESNFYKTFKQEFGISPNEFIIEQKLRLAESILKERESSIKEAYLSSGFNSFSYFCRIFKKKYKISPTQFKNNIWLV